ncbi:hypothetical protein H4S07_003736 [Coemansia furcata]|uniref:Uncharacterized protein n=1 Tax=Coemansia furcata TaxID=417177 RepID=A0ACC1LF08_9FUNG|nr:hypothetical protein H4S07_003736 [Coemansia furcata]
MQSPSSLQLLPLHITESVVDYVVGSPRSLFFEGEPSDKNKDTYEDTRRQAIMPLLWVCRNFRTIVYSCFCKVYTLELNMISNVVSAQRSSWPQCMRMIEYPTHYLSKELVLRLDQWTMFNGKMREALLNSRFSGFSFPSAQLLILDFIPGKINCSTKAEGMTIESNIIAFAELLWQMAPEATEIKLTSQFFLGQVRKTDKLRFIDTIFQLHQYYNRIGQKSNFVDGFAKVLKSKISDVVCLECRLNGGTPSRIHLSEDNHGRLLQLAQQSAATLQSLSVYIGKVKDATGIILRSDRSRVQYPCLHTLKLYGKQIESSTRARHG